jgi:cell division protein FtsW
MTYLKQVINNFKVNTPIFTVIGVFAAVFIGFNTFPEDKLPIFLKQSYLLIYLYSLVSILVFISAVCILAPMKVVNRAFSLSIYFPRLIRSLSRISNTIDETGAIIGLVYLSLIGLGIVIIYSVTVGNPKNLFYAPLYFLKHQVFWSILSVPIVIMICFINYSYVRKIAGVVVILNIIFLTLPLTGFQFAMYVNKQWQMIDSFRLLNYFEIVKISIIIYWAKILSNDKIKIFSILPVLLIFVLIYLFERKSAIGMLILLLVTGVSMGTHRYGRKYRSIGSLIILGAQFAFILILGFYLFRVSQGLGGYFGVGLGRGSSKLFFSNVILTTMIEELGLIGVSVFVLLVLIFVTQCFRVALETEDIYGRLIVFGSGTLMGFQTWQQIGAFVGIFPETGVPLPFVNYGSLSIVVNAILTGLTLNVCVHRKNYPTPVRKSISPDVGL